MAEPSADPDWLELLKEPAALIDAGAVTVATANARFAARLGIDRDRLTDAPLTRLVSPADTRAFRAFVATKSPSPHSFRFLRGGARPISCSCDLGPTRSQLRLLRLLASKKTSPLNRQFNELQQKLAWFREAIDRVGHSVVIFDKRGRLVLCNKYYRDGYRAGDRVLPADIALEGKTYRELMELRVRYKLHKEMADDPERFIEDRVRRFEEATDHITYLANGHVVRAQYRRLDDGIRVYIGTDVTELVETEQKRLATELAYRAKSQFLANMSHELRTPLNAIIGFSQVIRDATMGPVDARYRAYADDINGAGQHLLDLINDILDLSKIEVGRLELRGEPVDLVDLVRNCCRMVRERVSACGQVLEQEVSPDLPCLMADELRLRQIVINLLSNAVKFTPAGGSIRVSASLDPDGRLALAILDTGSGMKPDEIAAALTPFQQLDRERNHNRDGTGLGLPLAKTLAEAHGASFEIDSEPNVGTTVTIAFPRERLVAREPAPAESASA